MLLIWLSVCLLITNTHKWSTCHFAFEYE